MRMATTTPNQIDNFDEWLAALGCSVVAQDIADTVAAAAQAFRQL